jgi:hypothetical protein
LTEKEEFQKVESKLNITFRRNGGIYLILFILLYYSTIGLEILSNNQTYINIFPKFTKFDTILNRLGNEPVGHADNMCSRNVFLKKILIDCLPDFLILWDKEPVPLSPRGEIKSEFAKNT